MRMGLGLHLNWKQCFVGDSSPSFVIVYIWHLASYSKCIYIFVQLGAPQQPSVQPLYGMKLSTSALTFLTPFTHGALALHCLGGGGVTTLYIYEAPPITWYYERGYEVMRIYAWDIPTLSKPSQLLRGSCMDCLISNVNGKKESPSIFWVRRTPIFSSTWWS